MTSGPTPFPTAAKLLAGLPSAMPNEVFTPLLTRSDCRIERIVSRGQITPPDRPFLQDHDEWVLLLLAGAARLAVEGTETVLQPSSYMLIPAGARHHVTLTDPDGVTVWLAVHLEMPAPG